MLGMRLCTETLLEAVASHLTSVDNRALEWLKAEVLFDGNRCPELNTAKVEAMGIFPSAVDCQAWVKGDARPTSVAAASVLAKVSRDETMYALDTEYPEYGIAKHKGYPTRAHIEAIERYGILLAHRRSFAPIKTCL